MSYDLKILKDNPIGYWSFNNTANDLTINANNAYSNDDVLNLTPLSAGDVWTNSTGSNDQVLVGQSYTATAYTKTTTGNRNTYIRIDWYKNDNSLITTNSGSTLSANNTSWTQISVTATAPASAVYAITTITVQGATGDTDIQFIRGVVFNNSLLPVSRFVSGFNTNLSNTKASGYYTSPPIIANSGSSLKILNSSSVVISNTAGKYEVLSKNFENNTFVVSFWFSLNNQLNGSGNNSSPYSGNKLNLFNIKSGSVVIGKVYYDYLSNTIRFSITGSGNSDAYYVVNDLDKQFYVVATYSNQSTSIVVNGIPGETGSVLDTSAMSSYSKASLTFTLDGSSITGTSTLPQNFLVNSLAFFNYNLSQEQIKSHMLWAGNTEKPLFQGNLSASTSLFDFSIDPSEYGTYRVISGLDFGNLGTVTNLSVTKSGLQPLIINDNNFNKDYDSTATYSISSSSGISWSGSAGVDFTEINNYFSLTNGFVIGGSLFRTAASTAYTANGGEYVFGISSVNNGKHLFLEYKYVSSSWQYNLNIYDPSDATTTTLLTAYNTSFANDNFALKIDSNSIQLEILTSTSGSSASVSTTAIPNYLPLSLGTNSTLTIGNSYHSPKTFLSSINYVNLGNFSITSSSLRSIYSASYLTTPMTFMFDMSSSVNPFFVSQYGRWEFIVPSSNISNSYLQGTSFDWKSMDNCRVSISYDGGTTFSTLNRCQAATGYDLSKSPKNLVIGVDIFTRYDMDSSYQSFNNFSYAFYNDLDIYSDAEYYKISTPSDRTLANYIPQVVDGNILSRPENFGIRFTGDSNKRQGYGLITVPSTSSYRAIEFWYRPEFTVGPVARTNIIQNPSFESQPPLGYGWFSQPNSTSASRTNSQSYVGSYSAIVTGSYTSTDYMGISAQTTGGTRLLASPGATYTFSAYVRNIDLGLPLNPLIYFYGSAATPISIVAGASVVPTASGWTRISVTATAPANTASITPRVFTASQVSPSSHGKSFLVDAALLEVTASANPYFDGNSLGGTWSGTTNLSSSSIRMHSIISTNSLVSASPVIWINSSSALKYLGGTLYVNGASVSDGSFVVSRNELYHLTLQLSSSANSNLYLNGGDGSFSASNSLATYGYLQFWNTTPSSTEILARYNQFIGKVPARITDNNTLKVVSSSSTDRFVITKIG
jgi:hypothetical protein